MKVRPWGPKRAQRLTPAADTLQLATTQSFFRGLLVVVMAVGVAAVGVAMAVGVFFVRLCMALAFRIERERFAERTEPAA